MLFQSQYSHQQSTAEQDTHTHIYIHSKSQTSEFINTPIGKNLADAVLFLVNSK